jgi:hypothetical protein
MKKILASFAVLAMLVPALALSAGKVTEAKLGKSVVDRKLTDETTEFVIGEQAYVWMKLEGATGETITVTWKIQDQSYPVTLKVGASPWRTWASKKLHLPGEWTVTVTDASGGTLNESKLTVK